MRGLSESPLFDPILLRNLTEFWKKKKKKILNGYIIKNVSELWGGGQNPYGYTSTSGLSLSMATPPMHYYIDGHTNC